MVWVKCAVVWYLVIVVIMEVATTLRRCRPNRREGYACNHHHNLNGYGRLIGNLSHVSGAESESDAWKVKQNWGVGSAYCTDRRWEHITFHHHPSVGRLIYTNSYLKVYDFGYSNRCSGLVWCLDGLHLRYYDYEFLPISYKKSTRRNERKSTSTHPICIW